MTLFPLPTVAKFTDDWEPYTRVIPFGDGYSEREPEGSRPSETWDVEIFYATSAADAVLQAFLDEHGQHKPFEWQSPRSDTPNTYVIKGRVSGTTRRGGAEGFFYSRRCKFERVYGTALVSVSAVSTAANEGSSITVNFGRDRDTDQLLKVLFSIGGTATINTDYTVSGANTLTSIGGSVILEPGQTNTSIGLTLISDNNTESNETIEITVMESPDYTRIALNPLIITVGDLGQGGNPLTNVSGEVFLYNWTSPPGWRRFPVPQGWTFDIRTVCSSPSYCWQGVYVYHPNGTNIALGNLDLGDNYHPDGWYFVPN